MKKFLITLITIICAGGIVFGCIMWYKSATKPNIKDPAQMSGDVCYKSGEQMDVSNSGEQVDTPNSGEEKEQDKTPIFTLENYPKVDASLAIHPLVNSIASNFLGIPKSDLNFEYTKTRSSTVYQNLIDKNVDVIFAAPVSDEDLEYAKSKNVELKIIPATSSAFVFIVNTENPVDNLTLEQVQKIYKGEITNWKEVGGNDEEIIPYQRPNGSGSQTAMISLVMKDSNLMSAPKMKIEQEMGGLIDAIAEYDNAENAIGYSYFYYVNTMYKKDTVKMLAINGVKPTVETIKNATYPIYTNGFVVYRADEPEGSNTLKWVDAVLSERGTKIIEDNGYVAVN